MLKGSKDTIGIILTEESLRIAQMQISPKVKRVINISYQDIRQTPAEERQQVITSALKELKVKRPQAFCVIPSRFVTTKNIEIPSLDPQEIRSIIDLQAGRHTPFSREEILIGYVSIGIFQRNYTKVLLIIKHEVIKQQMEIFEQAGIRIQQVVFAPEAMSRFYGEALQAKEEDIPVGIINVDDTSTDFVVEFNRTVATYRSIPIGMSHLVKEGTSAQEKLTEELVASMEAYQNEDINTPPETFILTSDDAKVKELQPVFQERLKANIRVMPFLDLIEAPQPIMLKFVSEYPDHSFLDLISSAAALKTLQVDLTPDEIKVKRTIEEKGREVVKLGVAVLLILIFICAIFFSKIYFRGLVLDQLEQKYTENHRKVIVLDRIAQKTRIVKGFVKGRMTSLDIINQLYLLIPEEIYLENVMIDENGHITIQGISESMSRVFNFVSALEDSELFKSVKTTSTTAKKDRGKDAAAFEIQFRLESADDETAEELEATEEAPAEEAPA